MANYRGWWIKPGRDSAEFMEIDEHFLAVQSDPQRFGLDPSPVDHSDREATLVLVLRSGWVRAREFKGGVVYEFWSLSKRNAEAVWDHLRLVVKPWGQEVVRVNEVRTGLSHVVTFGTFFRDIGLEGNPDPQEFGSGGEYLYTLLRAGGMGRRPGAQR